MELDLTPFFNQYLAVRRETDMAFEKIREAHPDCVTCEPGCCDCCYALFDLSLIEALYVNHRFDQAMAVDTDKKTLILDRADAADRKIHKIKREAFQASQKGRADEDILARYAWERVRCPLLSDNDRCELYEDRPITCRLYGLVLAIGDQTHTCGKTGFEPGQSYPTVKMGVINDRLYEISQDLVQSLPTRYTKMADLLVPVSMALMTDYNKDYLGIEEDRP